MDLCDWVDVNGNRLRVARGTIVHTDYHESSGRREVADGTILPHQVASVSCQPRDCPRAEPKGREVGNPPATPVFGQQMKVYGEPAEPREAIFHSSVVEERDQLARRLITQASVREVLERYVASEVISRIDIWSPRL